MENRINQIMELDNGKKYIVVKQAIYKQDTYYVVARVTNDEKDIEDEYLVLKQIFIDGKQAITEVEDPNLFKIIIKYVGLLEE